MITQFIIRYSESKYVVQNINRIDSHAAFATPDEEGNDAPPLTLTLSHEGAREYWRKTPRRDGARGRKILVPSPLMREGEDEGEKPL